MPDLTEAQRELYAVKPADFLTTRTKLVAQARAAGDTAAATAIARLRKPTVAAWIVNVLALDRPEIVQTLTDLGAALRAAQDALDATPLRELSMQRRQVVAQLTRDAIGLAGRQDSNVAVRDEVSGTFDAAIADPLIAARLGRLERSQQWSGFGFTAATPDLTLVQGGRGDPQSVDLASADSASAAPARTGRRPASDRRKVESEQRARERALTSARQDFDRAEAEHQRARDAEQELTMRIGTLGERVRALQQEIDAAKTARESARSELRTARGSKLRARSALNRALAASRPSEK